MAVTYLLSGATSSTGATVAAHVDASTSCRLVYATDDAFTSPSYSSAVTSDSDGRIKFVLTGLLPGTKYRYRVEIAGTIDTARTGKFRTHPAAGGSTVSFATAFMSCARDVGTAPSNHPVHSRISEKDPLFLMHMGDLHYANINTNDQAAFRSAIEGALTTTNARTMYEGAALAYLYDDHDFGIDNSDRTSPSRPAVTAVYRQVIPHYPLAEANAIYHTFTVGHVRFIVTDERYYRDPYTQTDDASKTMLGTTQKAWFKSQVLAAKNDPNVLLTVWVSSQVPNVGFAGNANWGDYHTERVELWDFFAANSIKNLIVLAGDTHAMGFQRKVDLSTSQTAPIRVYMSSALEQLHTPGSLVDPWQNWDGFSGSGGVGSYGQYATLNVVDNGTWLSVTAAFYAVTYAGVETQHFTDTFTVGTVPTASGLYAVRDANGYRYPVRDSAHSDVRRYVAI